MKYKTSAGIELEGTPQEIAEYFYEKHRFEEKETPIVPLPQQTIPEQVNQTYRSQQLHDKYLAKKRKEKEEAEAKREKKREYQRRWCAKKRAMKNKKPKTLLGMSLTKYIASKSDLSLDSLISDLQAKGIKVKRKNLNTYIKIELKKRVMSAQKQASTTETAPKNDASVGIASIFGGV